MATSFGGDSATLSTSLSGISSSILEAVDFDIVEAIIDRSPRSATSFPSVYRAYGQVLQEHGLSASSDTAYYQFLLKLGVIRAANWGERWDAFKRSRIESDALEDVKYYEKSAVRSKATQNTKNFVLQGISDDLSRSRIAETRARVPFLASASSDLDEAFGDETYDGDAESIVGALRPSPRKSMGDKRIRDSRSMVGYTPSQSLDYGYDSISLNPPARTSTPINAQATKGGLFGLDVKDPPLPPYSVSDVSERIDNLSLKPESPSTPKAAPLSWEGYKEDEDTLREMENRADEFYRTGLMGRCWDVWHESYDWVKQTTGQIDTVRSTILLRQTLLKWKSEHDRILALPGTADAHHRSHLLSTKFDLWATKLKKRENARRLAAYLARKDSERLEQSWTKWRQDLVQRRTTRWERDMKQREKAFVKASSSRKLANTFDKWYDSTRTRVDGAIADDHYISTTLSKHLSIWQAKTGLSVALDTVLEKKKSDLQRTVFGEWRRRAALAESEEKATSRRQAELQRSVWDTWRSRHLDATTARTFNESRIKSYALGRLKEKLSQFKAMHGIATQYRDRKVVRKSLHLWVVQERGVLFKRVKEVRLGKAAVTHWKQQLELVKARQVEGAKLQHKFQHNLLYNQFSRWRSRLGFQRQSAVQAVLHNESTQMKHLYQAFNKWATASRVVAENDVAAQKARAFFLQRTVIRTWKIRLREREQTKLLERKKLERVKACFDIWKAFTKQSKEDKVKILALQRNRDQRTQASILTQWTARVLELKAREHAVTQQRRTTLKREALSRWLSRAATVKNAERLMQSFTQVRHEELARSFLVTWRQKASKARRLRLDAEQSLIERDDRLALAALTKWRDLAKERKLRAVEAEVADRHEDALMFAVWDKWKSKSKRLPCVTFTKRRIMRTAFHTWKQVLVMRQKEKSMSEPMRQELLADVFAVWKEAARRKLERSAIRRRGRLRPGSSITAGNTSHQPGSTRAVSLNASESSSRAPAAITTPYGLRQTTSIGKTAEIRRHRTSLPANTVAQLPSGSKPAHTPRHENDDEASIVSEPAYSRLRSELYGRGRRGNSEEA